MKFQFQRVKENNALIFRKWGRKNYSLFSTLKRVVKISVLSVTYFLTAPVPVVSVPRDTTETKMQYDLDEVEVTASRVPVIFSQVARILSVIGAQEIAQMPAESVQDLLDYISGVDIRQRGAEGVQADISIRGGTFDQILILLNGINITDPQTGHHNLNLPVSLSQIERIEVLEGPAARIYGPNAFSGAINIVTRKSEYKSLSFQLSIGNFGYFNTDLSGSFRTGKLNHLVAANRKSSNGYVVNTDFRTSNVYYSGELSSGIGKLFVQGGMGGKAFGANSFYTPVYPNQFEEVNTYFGSVRVETLRKFNLTPSVYWRRHTDKFMLFRDIAPDWYSNHNFHRTDVWGMDVNSWIIWKGGKTSFGSSLRSEAILSNVLGEPMENRIEFKGSDIFYTHSQERRIVSFFTEHVLSLNKLRFTTGIMVNHISDRKGVVNFFPGFDLSYQLFSPLTMVASWNTSLRMPTFTDLYYSGRTNRGNPELNPERSATMEGGVKLNAKILKGYMVFFHRRGTNLIDWVKADGEAIWRSMNHTEITSRGMEFNFLYFPSVHFSTDWPGQVEASYLYNLQKKEKSPLLSYYVMDNLRHKFVAGVSQPVAKQILLNLKAIYQDREGTFTFYGGEGFEGEREYKPFWTVDVKASCRLHDLVFFISATNLFDHRYYDIGNVIQPGRWMKAGVSYRIRKHE